MRTIEPEAAPLGPKKTVLVIATVVGCIGILWPKIFHPMLMGGHGHSPMETPLPPLLKDRGPGCCGVVLGSEYMNSTMVETSQRFRESFSLLGRDQSTIRQERPLHMRPEPMHAAMRERGYPSGPTNTRTIIDGRPGPIPGMRPPMGGGAFQQASQKGNSMGLIMPLYTVGIIAFFVYTILKIAFKKPRTEQAQPYSSNIIGDSQKKMPSETQKPESELIKRPENGSSSKLGWKDHDAIVTAIQGLIDAADEQLKKRVEDEDQKTPETKSDEASQNTKEDHNDPQKVQILGLEVTSSYEGGQKWDRANQLVPPNKAHEDHIETVDAKEIYLEGTLPHESQILVSDSEQCVEEEESNEDGEAPAIILSSKMTLSLINLDKNDRTSSHGKQSRCSSEKTKGSVTELVESIGSGDNLK